MRKKDASVGEDEEYEVGEISVGIVDHRHGGFVGVGC